MPGTLDARPCPAGADISNTNSTGGAKGTGVIDIRNLNLPIGGQILVQFDITLAAGVANGTVVTNQSTLRLGRTARRVHSRRSERQRPADPDVAGDEDPTRVTIVPTALVFEKTVANVTTGVSPAAEARPGDRLRYRLSLQNLANFAITNVSTSATRSTG